MVKKVVSTKPPKGGKRKTKKPAKAAQNSGAGNEATRFKPGNEWRFRPGQSGNPGGRPKALGEAARKVLASRVPDDHINAKLKKLLQAYTETEEPVITWAEHIALTHTLKAASGNADSTREIRVMSEGNKITGGWQDEIVQHLREGRLTAEEVLADLGDELARPLLIAAGFSRTEGGEADTAGEPARA